MIGHTDGIDEIRELVYNAWAAGAASIVGYLPEMRFHGVESPELPDKTLYWARLSTTTLDDRQATLSTCIGAPNQRKYEEKGLVYVQVFAPKNGDNSDRNLGLLSELVQASLRGKKTSGGIWFTGVRIIPLSAEESFSRRNVVAEYTRDQVQ
jgi:hypothetical protein